MRRETGVRAWGLRGWILAGSLLGLLAPFSAQGLTVPTAHFESFPDTLQIEASCGSFENLSVNGDVLSATGCLFRVENTSSGDGAASAFERDPDSHFARRDSLTNRARAVLSSNQPYGLYALELELAPGSGSLVSAPFGFDIEVEDGDGEVEVEFEIPLRRRTTGLLFDPAAGEIPAPFQEPRIGVLDFFVSTLSADPRANAIEEEDDVQGIDFEAKFAWASGGEVETRFQSFRGRRVEVEGLVVPSRAVPEPDASTLWLLGLAFVAWREARTPTRARSRYGSRLAWGDSHRGESPHSRLDPT